MIGRRRRVTPMKIALVVKGKEDRFLVRIMQETENFIQVVGLADLSGEFSWLSAQEKKNYFVTSDPAKVAQLPEVEAVINTVEDREVSLLLKQNISAGVEIVDVESSDFFKTLLRSKEELIEARKLKGELWAILNSVQDAIEVADEEGVIKYVNPAFTRMTGIPFSDRVGKNIFEVSPRGSLASSLIKQKPVTGHRTVVGGSDVEVISHSSPIFVDGEVEGAVVVFQRVTDILKLMDELEKSNTLVENLYAQINRISGFRWTFETMVGKSKSFKAAVEAARKYSRSDVPVLIEGETGTGKEVFAQAMHHQSSLQRNPLIKVDASFIPESLLDLEFFGCEEGAYPGAVRTRLGKVELAQGGTLFIKGVCQLNEHLQEKLLKLIREGSYQRIGGEDALTVDIRVMVSSTRELKSLVRQGKFREDLYLELSPCSLQVPSLRQRIEDIPLLAETFLKQLSRKTGKNVHNISPRALQALMDYDWPGNLRELWNVMERTVMVVDENTIKPEHLSPYIISHAEGPSIFSELVPLDRMEQMMLKTALARFGETLEGKKKAARALNISLATLYNKLKKYQVGP